MFLCKSSEIAQVTRVRYLTSLPRLGIILSALFLRSILLVLSQISSIGTKMDSSSTVFLAIDLSSPKPCCHFPHVYKPTLPPGSSRLGRRSQFAPLVSLLSIHSKLSFLWLGWCSDLVRCPSCPEQVRLRRNPLCFSELGAHLTLLM